MGRKITISDGGKLVFEEANADGNFTATFIVKDLTDHRTITIPNKNVVLGGLEVGQSYPVTEGGTGNTSVPKNNLLVGSTDPTKMDLIAAPTVNSNVLSFDSNTNSLTWAPVSVAFTGEINTGANYDPTKYGVYAAKVGTQLRFRNVVAGNGIALNQTATDLSIYVAPKLDTLMQASPNGVLKVANGGTGSSGPTGGAQYLRSNVTNTGLEWVRVDLKENFSGEIEYPRIRTYTLSPSWPYACTIESITLLTTAGTINVQVMKNSTNVGSNIQATSTKATTSLGNTALAVGDTLKLAVTAIASVTIVAFAITLVRT